MEKSYVAKLVLFLFILFLLNIEVQAESSKRQNKETEALFVLAKKYYPDSLERSLNYLQQAFTVEGTEKADSTLRKLFYLQARIYKRKGQSQAALSSFEKALTYAHKMKDTTSLINTFRMLSNIYREKSNYIQAQQYTEKAYLLAQQSHDRMQIVSALIDQSYYYNYWARNDTALLSLNRAYSIAKEIGYTQGLARISGLIGNIYFSMENYELALKYYREAYELAHQLKNPIGEGVSLINIGISLSPKQKYKEAIDTLLLSIAILEETQIPDLIANALGNLATVYADSGNYILAASKMQECEKYYRQSHNYESMAIMYFLKSDIAFKSMNYQKSLKNLSQCMQYIDSAHFDQMREKVYFSYVKTYKHLHNYKAALTNYEYYTAINDSSLNEKMQAQLLAFEAKYKMLEKQQKIESLAKNKQLAELSRDKNKNQRNFFLVAFIFLIFLFFAFLQKRKKEKQLQKVLNEKKKIEKKRMEQKINFQSKQLTTHALNMLENSKLLQSLYIGIEEIKRDTRANKPETLNKLLTKINLHKNTKQDWKLFKMYFEDVHQGFFQKMRKHSPTITSRDEILIALIKLNLTGKEIASILNISPDSVKNARHRLRKKFNLKRDISLYDFIRNVD